MLNTFDIFFFLFTAETAFIVVVTDEKGGTSQQCASNNTQFIIRNMTIVFDWVLSSAALALLPNNNSIKTPSKAKNKKCGFSSRKES